MKLSSLVLVGMLVAALVVMSAPVAKADSLPPGDPRIGVGGAMIDAPAAVITPDFTISSATGSSPATSPCVLSQPAGSATPIVTVSPNCQFLNAITDTGIGQFIDALIFDLPSIPVAQASCTTSITGTTSVFSNCSVADDGHGGSVISFSGGIIDYGSIFTLEFDGFPAGYTAGGSAQLPEPGTLLLLTIGVVAVLGLGLKRSPLRAS